MNTTLNIIKAHSRFGDGWKTLLHSLGKTKADDEPLSLAYILKSNGIVDAIWALRIFKYQDTCLFGADVAESVLHIFENEYPDDSRPRQAIEAARLYHKGEVSADQLETLMTASADASSGALWEASKEAAMAAALEATEAVWAAWAASWEEPTANSWTKSLEASKAASLEASRVLIQSLFIKHFCEDIN